MEFGAAKVEPRQVRAFEIAVFEAQRLPVGADQLLHVFACKRRVGDGMNAGVRRRRINRHEKTVPVRCVPDPRTVIVR